MSVLKKWFPRQATEEEKKKIVEPETNNISIESCKIVEEEMKKYNSNNWTTIPASGNNIAIGYASNYAKSDHVHGHAHGNIEDTILGNMNSMEASARRWKDLNALMQKIKIQNEEIRELKQKLENK